MLDWSEIRWFIYLADDWINKTLVLMWIRCIPTFVYFNCSFFRDLIWLISLIISFLDNLVNILSCDDRGRVGVLNRLHILRLVKLNIINWFDYWLSLWVLWANSHLFLHKLWLSSIYNLVNILSCDIWCGLRWLHLLDRSEFAFIRSYDRVFKCNRVGLRLFWHTGHWFCHAWSCIFDLRHFWVIDSLSVDQIILDDSSLVRLLLSRCKNAI